MKVLQAYRFAVDPTPRQERMLASHVGARRFAFNWGLALVKERLEARARGEDVEVPWTLAAGVESAKAPRRPLVLLRPGRAGPGPSELVEEPQG